MKGKLTFATVILSVSNILIIPCLTSYFFSVYSAVSILEQTPTMALTDHIKNMAITTSVLMHPFLPLALHQDHKLYNDEGKWIHFRLEKLKEINRKILRDLTDFSEGQIRRINQCFNNILPSPCSRWQDIAFLTCFNLFHRTAHGIPSVMSVMEVRG